jgi:hypothetical protein
LLTSTRSNPTRTYTHPMHTFHHHPNSYQIPFYETSAKANVNVETAIMSMAKDVLCRLMAEDAAAPSDSLVRAAPHSARLFCFSSLAASKFKAARVRMGLKAAASPAASRHDVLSIPLCLFHSHARSCHGIGAAAACSLAAT